MIRKLPIALALGAVFATALPAAAYADGYLDEATQELQTNPVYVSAQVSDMSGADTATLIANIGEQDIGIVVLPAGASSEIGDINAFIADVASNTGYDTVLVSVGGDFEAGSRVLPSGKASELANEAEHAGSLSDGLNQFVDGVESVGVAAPPATSNGGGGDNGGLIVGGVAAGVVALVAAAAVTFFVLRRKSRTKKVPKEMQKRYDTPKEIEDLLDQVAEWRNVVKNKDVAQRLAQSELHVHEFFRRTRIHMRDRIQEMTGHYNVHLSSMLTVLKKYVDVEQHPEYTRDPQKILQLGERAVQQFERGVIQNIQEVEEGAITMTLVDAKMVDAMVKEEVPNYFELGNQPESEAVPISTEPRSTKRKRK